MNKWKRNTFIYNSINAVTERTVNRLIITKDAVFIYQTREILYTCIY